MKCENINDGKPCQTELLPGAKYCHVCGNPACTVKDKSEEKQTCEQCNGILAEGENICTSCQPEKCALSPDNEHTDSTNNTGDNEMEKMSTEQSRQDFLNGNSRFQLTGSVGNGEQLYHIENTPVFGAAKEDRKEEDVSLRKVSGSQHITEDPKVPERFRGSLIFGNTNYYPSSCSENNDAKNEPDPDQGTDETSSISATSDFTPREDDFSEVDSIASGSIGADSQEHHQAKKNRPNKRRRDKIKKQKEMEKNLDNDSNQNENNENTTNNDMTKEGINSPDRNQTEHKNEDQSEENKNKKTDKMLKQPKDKARKSEGKTNTDSTKAKEIESNDEATNKPGSSKEAKTKKNESNKAENSNSKGDSNKKKDDKKGKSEAKQTTDVKKGKEEKQKDKNQDKKAENKEKDKQKKVDDDKSSGNSEKKDGKTSKSKEDQAKANGKEGQQKSTNSNGKDKTNRNKDKTKEKKQSQEGGSANKSDMKNYEKKTEDANNKMKEDTATKGKTMEIPVNIQSKESPAVNTVQTKKSYAAVASSGVFQNIPNQTSEGYMTVCFHAIFSPSILSNPEKDVACISIQRYTGDGYFLEDLYKMYQERDWKDGFKIFYCMLPLPLYMFNSEFSYSYCVLKDGHNQNVVREHVAHQGRLFEQGFSRQLNFPLNSKGYHSYDGVVREFPDKKSKHFLIAIKETVFERLGLSGVYWKVLRKDAEISIQAFHPKWQLTNLNSDGINGDEMIKHIRFIMSGVRKVYCHRAGIWSHSEFDQVGAGFLLPKIQRMIKELNLRQKNSLNDEGRILHLVSALTLTNIVIENGVKLDSSDCSMLCEALLPYPDIKENLLPDVHGLNMFFAKENIRTLGNCVLQFARRIAKEDKKNPCWLFCVPMIHFLLEKCRPFEEANDNVDHTNPVPLWWGVDVFDNDHQVFQKKSLPWERPVDDMLAKLLPYFKIDYILPRTFMTALRLEEREALIMKNNQIPTEVILASVVYYLKNGNDGIRQTIKRILDITTKRCLTEQPDLTLSSLKRTWRMYMIALDIFDECYRRTGLNEEIITPAYEVFMVTLDLFDHTLEGLKETKIDERQLQFKNNHLASFSLARQNYVSVLAKHRFYFDALGCLQKWNEAFKIRVKDGKIKNTYLKFLEDSLRSALESQKAEEKILDIYCKNFDIFNERLQEILIKFAFMAVERCCIVNLQGNLDERQQIRYGNLLSDVFVQNIEKKPMNDAHETLDYILCFAPFCTFVEMQCTMERYLNEKCKEMLSQLLSLLTDVIGQLMHGSVLIRDLKLLLARAETFQKIVYAMKAEDPDGIVSTLTVRQSELDSLENTKETVQKFVGCCMHCHADTVTLEQNIKELDNMDDIPLKDLVQTIFIDEKETLSQANPRVLVFGFTNEDIEKLQLVNDCCRGLLFMKLWENKGTELFQAKNRSLQITEVLDEVWAPTYAEWKNICQKLKNGDILFSEFEVFFKKTNIDNIRKELKLISYGDSSDKWIEERMDQLKNHRSWRCYRFGAEAILEVVNEFELEGDFSQIAVVLELTKGTDTKMKKLDPALLDTCSVLKEVTDDRAKCLKTFIKCKPLVNWLKKTMPFGLKELKVFVDLASISAGEGDMFIDKVNFLHSATTGYAPLIFNLEKDCDSKIFLEKCQEVWKELAANPNLPQQLFDTNKELAWLQTVEKSHGSVEVSSLTQAEAINSRGIYKVGKLKKDTVLKKPVLSEVFELRITEEEGETLQRNLYMYGHLHDLQSRLMLVAGKAEKGKDEVDRFVQILDSVVRLGNIFTKLIAEGCVLFAQWHVNFFCDKTRHVCAFLNFGYGQGTHTIKGRIDDDNEDVSFIISKIAKFLEDCHENWLDYIAEKREKYYVLNYFTVDQMVILQQELVKIGTGEEPLDLIYPLLSAVKKECTKEDLLTAMTLAKIDVEGFDASQEENLNEDNSSEGDDEVEDEEPDDVQTRKFLDELTRAGYPLELAKKALDHIEADNITDGIGWCIEHEDDYEPEKQERLFNRPENKTEHDQPTFSGWTQSNESIQSITAGLVGQLVDVSREKSTENLIKDLKDLWERFLNSISSSVSDYLSVEHLGIILNRLSEQETFEVNRSLLSCFKEGEPNLIICPQSEIYNTVLSVYSHEDDRPLPQADEVLLCTPQTTLDMLEIFWRRALFADKNKVHCLVNADLLDYDVSDKGEKSLERHMKNADCKGIKYKLVVICSSENEYKSRIVAALDKYHRPQLVSEVDSVKKYLLNKLKIEIDETDDVIPAAKVDYERCSVRVVKSWRAGVGKSLYKKRMVTKLQDILSERPIPKSSDVTIPLHEKTISLDSIMEVLLEENLPPNSQQQRIFHIDIAHEVQEGVDAFLFQLLVLGCLGHSSGHVWRKSDLDYYIIESMPLLARGSDVQGGNLKCIHHCLDILPDIICRSPQESLDIIRKRKFPKNYSDHDLLFDRIEFRSDVFQRPYQYLLRLDANRKLDDVQPNIPEGTRDQCLDTLIRHCGIGDPSWSELHHFVSFLNKQLQDFEVSIFCGAAAAEDLPGFSKFVLRFLIQMSRDFSTRSLEISEESPMQMLERQNHEEEEDDGNDDLELQQYQMRRTWETSPHPYLFFNPDHHSMTFLGFNIEKASGNLVDLQTGRLLEFGIMKRDLFDALKRNRVNLAENFDALPRAQKIEKLCNVMGQIYPHDPDMTYELTTDNVKKILAIYMRFRCDIPVIIMGETGCGKTRLIKFLCSLQKPPGVQIQNMILMKVHGGTRAQDIAKKVRKAEKIARENATQYPNMDTVLFFDEANTTEAIGVIKEIMCDKSLEGKPIQLHEKLKIVAACNPYRKHSEELIKRLEQAGLGYHVDADNTTDRLGRVPMRRLVYRVQPLPQSMLPLVWDFGQLNTEVEEMYIRQMVLRYINNGKLPPIQELDTITSRILTVSQEFLRSQKDECSFVSLRDVERVLEVMSWFYGQRDNAILFPQVKEDFMFVAEEEEEEDEEINRQQPIDSVTRSLVLALGVCYHACLKNREEYRDTVAQHFRPPLQLPGGADQILDEIDRCQTIFLENVDLADNIARNQALKENVFMMIVCIELRIPLFLVGKPGSSKSLAKTIVADAMQGNSALTDLFKNYKQLHMVSFQCSPLSTPDGIVGTFRQCAAYQKDKNLDRFVSVVVLDEIGLAEDSPRMPLKTLHPLLEDGCLDIEEPESNKKEGDPKADKENKGAKTSTEDGKAEPKLKDEESGPKIKEKKGEQKKQDEEPEPHKKVAFIGISNWALDPAKMNRGILVQREVPDETELINSANGICSTDEDVLNILNPMFPALAASYLHLFDVSTEMREFFGLRDFYSLIKMLYGFVQQSGHKKPTWLQLKHTILRNFGGLENVEPLDVFYQKLSTFVLEREKPTENDPDCTSAGMIQACLVGENKTDSESRYLLLLTENYGALSILQQKILTMDNAVVIFGSSFPSDQEYTQVCRNINRIKVCMETGNTVILLNLENLYESLYDALNQYYVKFGGAKYVDLGLGTHRVKCRVHKQFRLIVVAEKQIVYDKFPIPLINRLEKHFLSLKTMLTDPQLELTDKLQTWAKGFCKDKTPDHFRPKKEKKKIEDCFMGYHADTCAAIILHVCQEKKCDDEGISQIEEEILTEAKSILLWCATPATVWEQDVSVFTIYFREQHHDSLADYLHYKMVDKQQHNIHSQITTNSKLLSSADIDDLCKCIPISKENITLLTLQSFDTEQQFSRKIKICLEQGNKADILLIVQCDCGDQNADLIACARYSVQEALNNIQGEETQNINIVFLVQLPGIAGGCFSGFQCGLWHSVHIDDLHPSPEDIPSIADMHGKSVSALLKPVEEEIVTQRYSKDGDKKYLNDILLYERNEDVLRPKRHFDINHLILKCVQPALAKVKDQEKDSPRGTERLKIVLKLLQQTAGVSEKLLDVIGFHLTNIMLEKEESLRNTDITSNWLSTEASRAGNINKAGTFRKFAEQCLHSKVIPILAGIIAFLDTNRNLNILINHDLQSWQVDLWFQIFSSFNITQLKYSNIQSPSRRTELQEVIARSTALEGRVFTALMPFSWLLYKHIDETLKTVKDKCQGILNDTLTRATEILAELPIGKVMIEMDGQNALDILKAYMYDFVHMVYPVKTENECRIVCENIMIGCKTMIRGEFGRLLPSLLGCHMTYMTHAARFKNFSYLMTVWPECSKKVLTFQESENMYLITDEEITIDILALHLLLKNLEPSTDGLNTQKNRMKWLRQLCDYRPIVERIFALVQTESHESLFGKRCSEGIQEARFLWTRAVVVKLFIEHIFSSNDEDEGIRCFPLWIALGVKADLKTIETLQMIEKFLKSCNRKVVTQYFGNDLNCISCEDKVQGAPVTLPCQHIVCRKCYADAITMSELECTKCHMEFPPDFNPDETPGNSVNIQKYEDYRRRCNSFFMEVVSQLCFSEGTPPSEEVIQKLLSYITGHRRGQKGERTVSRELTIFDDSFDPTPVVRSFLLQQLMHTSGEQVDNYLMTYFQHTNQLLEEDGGQTQSLELCLLILQCLEDSFHQQHSKRFSSLNQNYSEVMENNDEAGIIKDLLIGASPKLCTEIDTLSKIKNIANTRFALSIVAKYIHDMYGTAQRNRRTNTHIRRMFAAAAELCDDCGSPWPRLYFVKQLCRCYSIDSYYSVLKVSDVSFLQWVVLPQLTVEKVNECFDRYILCGETYTQIRETIVETIMNKDDTHLADLLQKCQQDWKTRVMVRLALHRDITMNLVKGEQHNFPEEGVLYLKQIIMNNQSLLKNRELTEDILENTVWKLDAQRNVVPNMDLAHQNLTCLLTHFLVLMREIPGKTTLVTPLQSLCLQPHTMLESYLPTMPEDEVADLKEALLAARATNPDENPVFYRCPNGHPYVIGDCGRPYEEDNCRTCGKFIGGKGHRLRSDNVKDEGKDRTETGHVLGKATDLGSVVAPERKLDRASFSILRLMTHISMYIGANVNPQALCYTIKPPIEEEEVPGYLLEHIDVDLNMIQAALGKNKDDVLILTHYILSQIMRSQDMAALAHGFNNAVCGLKSREGRAEWEELFVGKYIKPVLQTMEDILTTWNNRILNDKRLASDQLLQILYETKTADEDQDIQNLQNIPAMWRYKSRISIDHLMQTLNTSKQTCPVLRLFLKEEHHLRAIRLAPNILRLQKLLIQKYNKKLDRSEANTLKIIDVKEHMSEDRKLEEFEELLADYVEAWECVRESLETYACTGSETLLSINRDYCRTRINENTPLSYLLPTHKQAGLCSYILLLFLIEKQNQFMSNYCRQSNIREDSLPKVHVKDISSAHLISYHPDRDLLPMVLANCNYSFEVGQGTRVEYNFTNLERQLMDRFLFSKSVVVSTQEIETFTYRAESTNALVFKILSHRIKQERLGPSVQNQINKEIRNKSFPDLCESLDKLDIAISFLKSVGAHPESSLNEFMVNTLKMDNPFPSSKAQQVCNCKHTMSWWVTLALERTRRQAKYSGDAFEGLAENLKETLTDEQKTKVEEILEYMPLEHIDVLVYLVFECIVLNIDVPQNKDEDDVLDISQISLCDTLTAYVEASPYETDALVDSTLKTAISRLPSDPKDEQRIITGQSVDFWKLINQIFINKQPQRY